MEYQLSVRNDGGGAMRMQIVTDPVLSGAFQGKSFASGWTARNFVREGRFYHEETQGFASVGALALKDESIRLQMSGVGSDRQGTLEHQVLLGPADQAAAALLIGRTLTYRLQAPGPVTAAEPASIGGIEIEPVLQGAGATWQIPLPMLLRGGGQVVRFRTRFSAAGLALADSQSRSTTTVGGVGQTAPQGPAGQPALTLKALAGQWVGSASSGAPFSWNIREDGTFESVSSSGRTSGKIDVVEGRLAWTNVAGASGRLILDDAGRVLRGSVGGSAVTFELREMPVGPPMAGDTAGTAAPAISAPGGSEPRTASSLNKIMITVPGWIGYKDLVGHLQAMIPGGGGIKADYLAESFRQAAPDERHESFLWTGVIRDTFERGDLIGAVTQLRDYILTQTAYAANRGGGTVSIEAHSWGGVLSYLALRELQWDSRFVKSLASVRVNLDTFGSPVGYIEQDSAKRAPTSLMNAGLRTLLPLLDLEKAVTLDATKISWRNYLLVDDPIASTVRSLGNKNAVLARSPDKVEYSSTAGATTPQAMLSIPVHSQYYLVPANVQTILRHRRENRIETTGIDDGVGGHQTETWHESGSGMRTGCRNPANNGSMTYSGTSVVTNLPGGRYESELTREFGPGKTYKQAGLGTVAADGSFKGSFWEELWVQGRLDSRTEGTFQGRRRGDDSTTTFSGRFVVGETCSYAGTSVGRRSTESLFLSAYPLLSQRDPNNYRDPSLAEALDGKEPVKNLACLAAVYVMLARGHGDLVKMIDDFYVLSRGAESRPSYVGGDVPIDAQRVLESLRQGRPAILHGYGGPLNQHFVLAVGADSKGGRAVIRALDPWPGKNVAGPARQIEIDSGTMKHPVLDLVFTKMRAVADEAKD